MLDFPHAEYDSSASMMTAIKCQDDRVGERGARADWIWEFWQDQYVPLEMNIMATLTILSGDGHSDMTVKSGVIFDLFSSP